MSVDEVHKVVLFIMSSIDIFGRSVTGKSGDRGEMGPPGPRGPPGTGGIESITRWFPSLALSEFRKTELSCLLLTNHQMIFNLEKVENILNGYLIQNQNIML